MLTATDTEQTQPPSRDGPPSAASTEETNPLTASSVIFWASVLAGAPDGEGGADGVALGAEGDEDPADATGGAAKDVDGSADAVDGLVHARSF